MASDDIHGTVGIVRPTTRAGGFEDLIRMLPAGIGVTHTCLLPAQCWDIQRHLHVRIPVPGFGRLAAEMP